MLKVSLLEKDPNCLILTPELIGHGDRLWETNKRKYNNESEWTPEKYNADIINTVQALLSQYKISKFILVGHSL